MNNSSDTIDNGNAVTLPPRPPVMAVLLDGIPEELRAAPRWLVWCYTLDPKRGAFAKQPFVHGNVHARSDDPSTWQSFATACRRLSMPRILSLPRFDGLGFVLGDGWAGVDLDDCILPDGSLEEWAAEIVDELGSYTEVSPSGTGLKVFCRGDWPAALKAVNRTGGKRSSIDGRSLGGGTRAVEVYWERKFFCVTGRRWPDLAPSNLSLAQQVAR